jgi:hypothetical protein
MVGKMIIGPNVCGRHDTKNNVVNVPRAPDVFNRPVDAGRILPVPVLVDQFLDDLPAEKQDWCRP